jgi:excisionase family DNA binding protein
VRPGADLVDDDGMALLLDLDEAAEVLRSSRRSVERYVKDGALPSVTIGSRRLVRGEDLRRFVEELPNSKGKSDDQGQPVVLPQYVKTYGFAEGDPSEPQEPGTPNFAVG